VVATAALAVGLAPAAYAQSQSKKDPKGDMLDFSSQVVRREKRGDIVRSEVGYAGGAVTGSMKLRALPRKKWWANVRVVTPDSWYQLMVTLKGTRVTDAVTVIQGQADIGCDPTASVAGKVVTLSLPANCLGDPAWVRMGTNTTWRGRAGTREDHGFKKAGRARVKTPVGSKLTMD